MIPGQTPPSQPTSPEKYSDAPGTVHDYNHFTFSISSFPVASSFFSSFLVYSFLISSFCNRGFEGIAGGVHQITDIQASDEYECFISGEGEILGKHQPNCVAIFYVPSTIPPFTYEHTLSIYTTITITRSSFYPFNDY